MVGAVAAAGLDRSLPWFVALALFVLWAGLLVGLAVLVRRRLRVRADRRDAARRQRGPERPIVMDDRSIGPGTDVEVW